MLNRDVIVGVCGAGAMGAGIAQVAAQAGHRVIVLDRADDALARGRAALAKGLGALVKRGRITEGESEAIAARCSWTLDVADFGPAGLVIEAIVENPEIKRALFQQVEDAVADEAVIATNTSSLSVTALASGRKNPSRYMGLHFFNPAPIMKLVEVISGAETDPSLACSALDLMKSWGKTAVMARDAPGFIVNRVARPYYGEGWRALEEGAGDAATLDFLYCDLAGFRMGPFELGDLIGHDINVAAAKSVFGAYFGRTRFTPSLMQSSLVDAGRLGRKSGAGVFDYAGDEKPAPVFAARARANGDNRLLQKLIGEGAVEYEGARIMRCDGRTALNVAAKTGAGVAVVDFIRDRAAATAIAFAASDEKADAAALSFISACGKDAVRIKDRAGLVVYRTLLQLANCAADAIRDRSPRPGDRYSDDERR
ncbi:MAG: 3-hydroxyacyl-CoA dehydrogenase NAD-binding domain-containing protein [Parvularculaceae bacterium]